MSPLPYPLGNPHQRASHQLTKSTAPTPPAATATAARDGLEMGAIEEGVGLLSHAGANADHTDGVDGNSLDGQHRDRAGKDGQDAKSSS